MSWGAAIENKFIFGGVAKIYRYDDALGIGAEFLVVGAGGGAELFRSLNTMTRRGLAISKDGAEHFGGLGEYFGGRFLGRCAPQHTTLVLGVHAKPKSFVLSDCSPVGWFDVVLLTDLLIAEQPFFVTGQIRYERTADVAVEGDCDAAQRDGFVAGLGCALWRARRHDVVGNVEAGETLIALGGVGHGGDYSAPQRPQRAA